MGLFGEFDERFANRLELLKADMDKTLAEAHRHLVEYNAEFVAIYNELHEVLHGTAEQPPARLTQDDPDAEAKARVDALVVLPKADMEEFERLVLQGEDQPPARQIGRNERP